MAMRRFSKAFRRRKTVAWSLSKPSIIETMPFDENQIARKKPKESTPLRVFLSKSSRVSNTNFPAFPGMISVIDFSIVPKKSIEIGKYGSSETSTIIPGKMDKKKLKAMLFARVTMTSSLVSSKMNPIKLYSGIFFKPGKECVRDHSTNCIQIGSWAKYRLRLPRWSWSKNLEIRFTIGFDLKFLCFSK